jgi:hypothetical protein
MREHICVHIHADADLASEFSSFVLRSGQANEAAPVTPSPLLPPHSVVAAQMEALQRNDYPETDAGVVLACTRELILMHTDIHLRARMLCSHALITLSILVFESGMLLLVARKISWRLS